MPLSDACIFIERNEPRIQSISTSLTFSNPLRSFVMQIRARNEGSNDCHLVDVNHDVGSDDDLWQRLGRAISCNASLGSLVLDVNDDHDIGHFSQRAVQNARALFRGLSQNKSVHHLALIFRETPLLMFDFLTHFVQHNRSLRDIHFDFRRPLLTEQSQMLSNAIGNAELTSLNLANCFVDHESLNRIIPRCTGVERLIIQCNTHENYAAVAALIQDPHTALTSIRIYFQGSGLHPRSIIRCSPNDGFVLIISSLNGNETLKCLEFRGGFDDHHGNFINLLCDFSSIESIHNSNHTLEQLEVFDFTPEMIRSCIVMNQNANKTQVIRQKIAEYYFRGDFDIAPFVKMSISLLPSVLGLIRGSDINRHSAIYQMLKCIPDLCDVTTRNARQPNQASSVKRMTFDQF
ncbi:hypothetical protein ACHAWO_000558 [Cyclotella atomus]|uniref:Uncharacterized protein n=1 Tax=Cyclotella atomus TaxID=382360 RepID=A0ABD3P7G2_9STRA